MASTKDLQRLFQRYLNGQCGALEIAFLLEHFGLEGNESPLRGLIESELAEFPPKEWEESREVQEVFKRVELNLIEQISRGQQRQVVPLRPTWYQYAGIAASALIVFGLGLYFFKFNPRAPDKVAQDKITDDALPGGNRATLTLADGSILNLDSTGKGEIARQAGVVISKTADGELIYKNDHTGIQSEMVSYNTIMTPNGGQYNIVLPDGSKVWLNAASSLVYPISFKGSERRVTLSGEAYFEIAKDKSRPFIVKSGKQQTEVLGTHFNINAYGDEAVINTTLLEGSIKVSLTDNTSLPKTLRPGQQATVNHNIKLVTVDVEQAVAWKNGMFYFQDTSLKEVMCQLERWYDVKVDYSGMPDARFGGEIPRNAKLSSVLKALELTNNVKFKIEERRIMLMR